MQEKEQATITIPASLYEKIEKRIEGTEFSSVSEWATYVLKEVLANLEEEEKEESLTKKDEERIKERLKALGYL